MLITIYNSDLMEKQVLSIIESVHKLIDLRQLIEDVQNRINSIVNIIYEKITHELDVIAVHFVSDEKKEQSKETKSVTEFTSTTLDAAITENAIILCENAKSSPNKAKINRRVQNKTS